MLAASAPERRGGVDEFSRRKNLSEVAAATVDAKNFMGTFAKLEKWLSRMLMPKSLIDD